MVGLGWSGLYLPAALHGIEASLSASDSQRKLRSSIHRVFWSRRQHLARVGAVLSLLDGPLDVILLSVWSGLDFGCCVAILLFGLRRLVGFAVCLRWLVRVVLGMVLFNYSLPVLLRLGFGGILSGWVGLGLGCLCLKIWLALLSI